MIVKKYNPGKYVDVKGSVCVTDPCYEPDVWCRINNLAVKKGKYGFRYYLGSRYEDEELQEDYDEWGKDISDNFESFKEYQNTCIKKECVTVIMQYQNRSFSLNSPKWEKIGTIGVDTGMAGFFWQELPHDEKNWQELCKWLEKKGWTGPYFKEDYGFWTMSGLGDGEYPVFAIHENNEIIALKIEFV